MIGNYSARLSGSKRNLIALLASSAVFTVGCSNMSIHSSRRKPSQLARHSQRENSWRQSAGQSAPPSLSGMRDKVAPLPWRPPPPPTAAGSFSFIKDTANGNPPTSVQPTLLLPHRHRTPWSMSSPRAATPRTMERASPTTPPPSSRSTASAASSVPPTSSI